VPGVGVTADTILAKRGTTIRSVILWDTITGKKTRTLKVPVSPIRSLAFNQTGTRLAVGLPKRVKVWDMTTGVELQEFESSIDWIVRVGFHPNDMTVLGEGFWTRMAWNTMSGQPTSIDRADWPHEVLDPQVLSSDGRWILIPSGSHVRVADVQFGSGKEEQAYHQAQTSRSAPWHQQQATMAEENSNWFAASFRRAWQFKIAPTSKDVRETLQRVHKKLRDGSTAQPIIPSVVTDVVNEPR